MRWSCNVQQRDEVRGGGIHREGGGVILGGGTEATEARNCRKDQKKQNTDRND